MCFTTKNMQHVITLSLTEKPVAKMKKKITNNPSLTLDP